MTSTTRNLAGFREIVIVVLVLTGLALLATALYAMYPQHIFVSGALGRGVSAQLLPGKSIEQKIVAPTVSVNKLFITLDAPSGSRLIQAELLHTGKSETTSLGSGRPTTLKTGEENIPGIAWSLPYPLSPGTSYTVRLSLPPSAHSTIELIADERDRNSFDAAVIRDEGGHLQRQNFSLSLSLASRQTRWTAATATEREEYMQATRAIIGGTVIVLSVVIFIFFAPLQKYSRRHTFAAILFLLIVAAIAGRMWFAFRLPLVNDEQFYIYDAVLYNPYDPVFWKTPLFITALFGWIQVVGIKSLLLIRLLVIISSTAGLGLLAYIAYRLGGKVAGWATLAVGLFLPVVISYSSLVMTEQFMLLPLIGAAVLAIKYREKARPAWWQLILISILVGLATATRWSGIFWLVGITILLRTYPLKEFTRRMMWLVIPFAASSAALLALFPNFALEFRAGEVLLEFFELSQAQGWGTKLLSWREPALRLSPLLLLSVMAWTGSSAKRKMLYGFVAAVFLVLFFPAWQDTGIMPKYPISPFLFFLLALGMIASGAGIPGQYQRRTLIDAAALFIPPLVAYFIFHKINPKYLAEFMPALVLFASLGLATLLKTLKQTRSPAPTIALLFFIWWLPPWISQPLDYPYAGTISLAAMDRAVEYLKIHVGPDERVLTASSLIPLIAGKQPAYPISHPAWIRPTFRGEKDPRYEAIYAPVIAGLESKNITWVIDEKLTTDTYRQDPRINAAISALYEPIAVIENQGQGPLIILRLKE